MKIVKLFFLRHLISAISIPNELELLCEETVGVFADKNVRQVIILGGNIFKNVTFVDEHEVRCMPPFEMSDN